ncbi:hypothetical protein M231_03504 [Tremella mesenterica]|uniref:PWWP domain-containing protein n=1 Tax=Tremella mesenterica TaxID=5217 RepID=A0A4Q1BN66_TREME|nr:hypothetical protein M231_03504 [Tremella mesenterica]
MAPRRKNKLSKAIHNEPSPSTPATPSKPSPTSPLTPIATTPRITKRPASRGSTSATPSRLPKPTSSPPTGSSTPTRKKRKTTKASLQASDTAETAEDAHSLNKRTSPSPIIATSSSTLIADTLVGYDDDDDDDIEILPSIFDILFAPRLSPSLPPRPVTENDVVRPPPKVENFRPTTLPVSVNIGDAVYARRQRCFWPAVLVEFRPAQDAQEQKKGKDRYVVEVRHQPGKPALKRKDIIFQCDAEIADCVLGEMETRPIEFKPSDALTRQTTPSIDPAVPFEKLERRDQLVLLRPHLSRIISETYPPAQWRIDRFFGTRNQREALSGCVQYGDILEKECAEVIVPELQRWALRERGDRKRGSERYESLSEVEKRGYLNSVLLPEAIIGLCIKSEGLDEEKEEDDGQGIESHENGASLLSVGDSGQSRTNPQYENEGRNLHNESQHLISADSALEDVNVISEGRQSVPDKPLESCNLNTNENEYEIYKSARKRLDELRTFDQTTQWDLLITDLNFARRRMRQKRHLEPEHINDEERQRMRLSSGQYEMGWVGRARKVKSMKV